MNPVATSKTRALRLIHKEPAFPSLSSFLLKSSVAIARSRAVDARHSVELFISVKLSLQREAFTSYCG
jgi:hypothetical protein